MENNVNYQEMYDRFDAIEKKHQEIKKMLSETNILVDSLKADSVRMLREKQGVSDEEFREAYKLWDSSLLKKREEIWGVCTLLSFISDFSLSEFVSKYKEYKDKKDDEIKVGDVVNDGYTVAIVTCAYEKSIYVLYRDGSCGSHPKYEYIKTGKHYDSIDEFMNG